jgi:Icc-related predicted phosphoesterase
MKILCISDTHCKQNRLTIPECDVLIISGDVCSSGEIWQFENFVKWLKKYESAFKKAFLIAGNHDWCLMKQKTLAIEVLKSTFNDKVEYLEDSEFIFEGIKFYGSPWQPTFFNWAFNLDRGEKIQAVWNNIPADTQVLITHGPPFGIGDMVNNNHVGCIDLLNKVRELKDLFLHVFGHIHDGNGHYISDALPNVNFCNASICDESYNPVNSAFSFNLLNLGKYHTIVVNKEAL